ncbi:MAG: PD-(D/E)XK nuclease family protein, partial [Candidatus Abyssubacteria bacterium]|nr:PD-(D/E)XK nuclease family protein [Candidatus Abyssubacteria bacterium]
ILQSDMGGLNDAMLHALCKSPTGADAGIYEVLRPSQEICAGLRPRTHDRLLALLDAIQELANRRWSLTLGELISEALDRTGYLKYLASIEGPRGTRFSNVSTFYKTATLFEERHPGAGLEEFLTYLETVVAGDAGPTATDAKRGAVQLMTVHQAKGLEFPVVFVVNLRAGAFPLKFRSDGFGYGERFGLFAKNLPAGGEAVRYRGEYGVGIEKNLRERHYFEECRIMYVAMTRAQDILHLTTSSPEDEEDFFRALESFADEDGARCVEVVRSFSIPAGLPEQETAAAQCGSIAEIRLEAAKAVERIARTPSTGPATGEDWSVALSYSSLVLFRQCPMKYALRYVYNLPLSPHEESGDENHSRADAFALGNLLHGVLMQYHRQNRSGAKADAFEIFENLSRGCPQELLSAGREMIGKYLDSPLSQTNTLDEEKEFHWRIECGHHKIMLEGKIDRIHYQGDSLKIVDYKTGSRREESHRLQLGIYRLAIEAVLGKGNILTSNFYLSTGEEVEYRFTAEELNRIRDDIIEDARKIAGMIFEVSGEDGRHSTDCPGCGYAGFCLSRGAKPVGKN